MPRVKRGTVRRAKRKKLLGLAKGYYANKSKLYRAAKESVDTALKYAFVGRRRKKRDFRRLWVVRINAAARENGLTYGQLINGLKNAGITLDRKSLSELAVSSPGAFARLVEQAKGKSPAGLCPFRVEIHNPAVVGYRLLRRLHLEIDVAAQEQRLWVIRFVLEPPVQAGERVEDAVGAQVAFRQGFGDQGRLGGILLETGLQVVLLGPVHVAHRGVQQRPLQ